MALKDDINNLPTTPGEGFSGHLANHKTIHAGLKDHESRIVRNELAVPSGLEIKKDTTVGTCILAGSTMLYGDTGWRNVTSLLSVQPNSGVVAIKRTAGMVHLVLNYLTYNAGVVSELSIPQEWWCGTSVGFPLVNIQGETIGKAYSTYTGIIRFTFSVNGAATMKLSLESSQKWPTSFIGE